MGAAGREVPLVVFVSWVRISKENVFLKIKK
jgi:hypothetical protein